MSRFPLTGTLERLEGLDPSDVRNVRSVTAAALSMLLRAVALSWADEDSEALAAQLGLVGRVLDARARAADDEAWQAPQADSLSVWLGDRQRIRAFVPPPAPVGADPDVAMPRVPARALALVALDAPGAGEEVARFAALAADPAVWVEGEEYVRHVPGMLAAVLDGDVVGLREATGLRGEHRGVVASRSPAARDVLIDVLGCAVLAVAARRGLDPGDVGDPYLGVFLPEEGG